MGPYLVPIKPGEEIVITGMSGKFPDSNNISNFRDNLFNKVDLISDDYRRWKPINPEIPQRTGKLFDVDKFDSGFFGVPFKHSHNMDPMCRMVLERVYEALLDAGHHPFDLEGTRTGVYVASCFSETEKSTFYTLNNLKSCDSITGCQRSMFAKRIGYHFKLNAVGFNADTACSSSLYAIDHAYRHLREGRCQKAIICGTHLCLLSSISLQFARLGVLSPDGSCKSFDNTGNGYVRSEAVSVILLEKLKDAKRVYAEVVHSKTNCDGYKEQGITFPSTNMQKVLMKEFYEECHIDPMSLTMVEAHGTGTEVGDPEELTTIDEIFSKNRSKPLYVGSVKSNMGHSEPAAGICSIIKVLIGFENGFIPPNVNYNTPKKGVESLQKGKLVVVTEKIPWPDNTGLVGINSFGFGGGNGHVLLRWNPKMKINRGLPNDNLPRLVCASGRTKESVSMVLDKSSEMDTEFIKLVHQIFRKTVPNLLYNGYVISTKQGEVERVVCENHFLGNKLRIVFTNIEDEWFHCCRKLIEIPSFSESIQGIHDIVQKEIEISITEILIHKIIGDPVQKVLGFVAVQLALADLIQHLHLKFDEIIGIGYGELAAAYLDGFLTLKETILATYYISTGNKTKMNKIFSNKVFNTKKWLRTHLISFPQGSLDYFIKNISKPIDYKQETKNIVSLVIGPPFKMQSKSNIVLFQETESDPIQQMLQSLDRLYLLGFPAQLDNIYPTVSYPVSRGTPMLSPLIKWKHSESYTVYLNKNEQERKNGQRIIRISARYEDWKFISGHVIDGRNLFPATGYLALVWETYAIIMGKLTSETSVVLEDVKFLRAANVPKEKTLRLKVSIQVENKTFEVTENNNLLVIGKMYSINQEHKIQNVSVSLYDSNKAEMDENDVYKELKVRGYHHADQFRSIKKFNWKDNKAIVAWTGNWTTFMDNMLQLKLLDEDSRSLYVPTSVNRVILDGPKHIKYTTEYNNMMPVVYHKNLGLFTSGGIQITGVTGSMISRRKTVQPTLETYKFIPYHGKLKEDHAVRCIVQTILENASTLKVKALEVLDDEHAKPILPLVQQTLDDLPLIQAELKILSKRSNLDLPGILIEDRVLDTESGYLILIATNVLQNKQLLSTALRVTREVSGFIISKESKGKVSNNHNPQIQVLCSYETETEHLFLIQRTSQYVERIPVKINSIEDFSWMETLQNYSKNLLVYSEKNSVNGLLGFINCLRRETSYSNSSAIIIMGDAPPFNIKHPFYKSQLEKNLAINIFKDGQWGCYRHLKLPEAQTVECEHCYVNVTTIGDLSSLRWIEGPLSSNTHPELDKKLVNVHYASLNFRDIMIATGKLTPDVITRDRILQECNQGSEFSGCLRADKSKKVMGICVGGSLSTMIMPNEITVFWSFPNNWSYEDAATVPVAYGTVLYALIMRGHLKRGQSILIHSGTGGVGQAAINIATHMECTIFTTVGSVEKREFIKRHFPQIKEEHIGDSRSTSFEQMIFQQTNGRGVDFVLNSLAEEMLQASVRCLARNGTFIEIGKFDMALDNKLAPALLKKQARFEGVMLDHAFAVRLDNIRMILANLMQEGILNGSVKPLVRKVFTSDKIEEAYRFMATGKHIGKVIVKIRDENVEKHQQLFKGIPRISCADTVCYVILGGLGGFGLELADWLVTRGVKHLVLTSRTGLKNGYKKFRLNIFKTYGVETHVRNDDITTEEGCRTLLTFAESLGPVEGIFNLAVVLKDALFENQTVDSFKASLQPKAFATHHLDVVSREICPNLKYFVVFSSVSCGRGNVGQTNYGMANSIMERICEKRKEEGYPGLAIQWGAIGDVGLVAEMQENHRKLIIGGTLQQGISNCLQVLDRLLKQEEPIVASMVVAEKKLIGDTNIFDAILNIIGITNLAVSHHATLPELGMDSIMAIEIKQTLEREYEIFLTPKEIRNMTIAKLKQLISQPEQAVSTVAQNILENDFPEDVLLLFRHIGHENTSNEPIIHLKSSCNVLDSKSKSTVIAFAGIEGMAEIYESISKQLQSDLMCLQFCAGNHVDSIEELAEPLAKTIISNSTSGDFTIVAYSFGCVVAIEIMYILESLGRIGKAFFIDGAPKIISQLMETYFPFYDDETLETTLLCILMARYMPFSTIVKYKAEIIKRKTYEEKIKYIMTVSPTISHSEKYIVEICKAALSRLKAIRKYKPRFEKLKSKITLAKPTMQSILEIEEDYNLSAITTQWVDVKIIEGNHVTILENDELVKNINNFLKCS